MNEVDLDIADILSKAVNGELLRLSKPTMEEVLVYLRFLENSPISGFWSVPGMDRRVEAAQSPSVVSFILSVSERFLMLVHQELSSRASGKPEVVRVREVCWWAGLLANICDVRAGISTSSALSKYVSSELSITKDELLRYIENNYWEVVLYLIVINGTVSNINEILVSQQ